VSREDKKARRRHSPLGVAVCLAFVFALILVSAPVAEADASCVDVVDSFASSHSQAGTDFFVTEITVPYTSGPVTLAKDCAGTQPINVDDGIVVESTRPDGSDGGSFSHDFSAGCSGTITAAGPFDLQNNLAPGENTLKFRLRDLCGQGGSSTSDLKLIFQEQSNYRVELSTWIPEPKVVYAPLAAPLPFFLAALSAVPSQTEALCGLADLAGLVSGTQRGAGFEPTPTPGPPIRERRRALGQVEFNSDGTEIQQITSQESSPETTVDFDYQGLPPLGTLPPGPPVHCPLSFGFDPGFTRADLIPPASFRLELFPQDPADPFFPTTRAEVGGTVSPGGNLELAWRSDWFPSFVIDVFVNGEIKHREIFDTSCLNQSTLLGFSGVGVMAIAAEQNVGDSFVVDPQQSFTTNPGETPLCSGNFLTMDFVAYGTSLLSAPRNGEAAGAAAIRVAPLERGKPGHFLSLETAIERGLVASQDLPGRHLVLALDTAQPVALKLKGKIAITTTRVTQGTTGKVQQIGPAGGKITATLTDTSTKFARNGKPLKPHKPDTRPPKTTAKVDVAGNTATVTLKARDPSGVEATIVTLGDKRLRLRKGRFHVAKAKLAKVRISSVDVYGNTEKPHGL